MKAFLSSSALPRRRFLRGLGALISLPPLEALAAPTAARSASKAATRTLGTTASGAPLRMMFVGFANGVNVECWRPKGVGREFELGRTFAPLASLQSKIQIMTGFAQKNANELGDGPGDHARACASLLTGAHPRKTAGADVRNGISMDQVAAQRLSGLTRLPSLELIGMRSRRSGSCDSGYSCAYEYNLSWASETMPMPAESDPREVFERLFGSGAPGERQRLYSARQAHRRSLLDFVREEAQALGRQVGARQRRKIDEYLTAVREVERQIQRAEANPLPKTRLATPEGIPEDTRAHLRLMADLMVLAFQSDSTRVGTFLFANEGNNRSFPELGIPEGHHHVSHHRGRAENLEKVAKIDHFYMEQLAYMLRKLDAIHDTDGRSVLDNSMVVYGCANGDGNKHNHDDLPIVVAGGGGGTLNPGRHVKLAAETPLCNLYLALLERMGASTPKLGDSTGVFADV